VRSLAISQLYRTYDIYMSQVNPIVIHVRAKQAAEYEKLFVERQLPRRRDYHQRGKFISARF
jgi:hypothetical protein